jgi:preprotein translocase subunit SecE
VSDELDGTDAITPRRPTGKRTRQRAMAGASEDITEALEIDSSSSIALDTDAASEGKAKPAKKKSTSDASRNPFVFVFNYLKQVVAELRKVIWPNRKQMVSYTTVVLMFLVFMVALIGVVDLGLAKLVLLVFG